MLLLLGVASWHLLRNRLDASEQGVEVLWVVTLVQDDVHIKLIKTLVLDEVLHGENVETHLLGLLKECLLLVGKVGGNVTWLEGLSH